MKVEEVTIIGAGPAGMAAAIQLKRSGIDPLILEKSHTGGLLVNANCIENYPGMAKGLPGTALVQLFEKHLQKIGATVDFEEVTSLDYNGAFVIQTTKRDIRSKIVVIASGTQPNRIDLPAEVEGKVFYEVRHIAGISGKKIAIIGAGDAAFDYALNLAAKNKVVILNKSQKRKCLPLLWERVQKTPSITYFDNSSVISVKNSPKNIVLDCRNGSKEWEVGADYAIFAIGRKVQLDYLAPEIKGVIPRLTESGLLYFVGDVKNDYFRQTSIATGDGVRAAMQIYTKLQETG